MREVETINPTQRIKNLVRVRELAQKHLAHDIQQLHQQNEDLELRHLKEKEEARIKSRRELSERFAKFRANHADEVNLAALSDPKNLAEYIHRHRDGWFAERDWEHFMGGRYIHEMIDAYINVDPKVIGLMHPEFHSCPQVFDVGDQYTVTGAWFGDTAGEIYFDQFTGSPGLRVDTNIVAWSENSVTFDIPSTSDEIPFDFMGRIYLVRPDGKEIWRSATLQPLPTLYHCEREYSDSGMKVESDFSPLSYEYSKEIVLSSPPLPDSYSLDPFITGETIVRLTRSTQYDYPDDALAQVRQIGIYTSGNKVKVRAEVTDDWHWDYTIRARFVIVVPQNIPVSSGWSAIL